jgi:HSP20 family protein
MDTTIQERYITPRVNVFEREDAVVIEAEVPGVARDNAEVELRDGTLHLKAHPSTNGKDGRYRLRERIPAGYYRAFSIGDAFDPDRVEARLQDGVLTVTLAKSERLRPRQVAVN